MTTRLVFAILLIAIQLPIFAQNNTLTYELAEVIIAKNRIQLPYAEQTSV